MTNGKDHEPMPPRQSGLHVAIIMDGSGRWAQARGLPRAEGHRAGRAALRQAVEAARESGIRVLTLFTFSTDNWGRPESEVVELMRTFEGFFRSDAPALTARGVRVTVMGRRDGLPVSLRDAIEKIEAASVAAGQMHVRLAIDYSAARQSFTPRADSSQQAMTPSKALPAC